MRLTCALFLGAAMAISGCAQSTSGSAAAPTAGVDVTLSPETRAVSARIARGMTLAALLSVGRVAQTEAADVISAVKVVFDPRRVRVDQPYRLVQAIDGALRSFEYEIDGDRFLRVSRPASDAGLVAEILPIPKTLAPAIVQGTISRQTPSLFTAVAAAGGTVDLSIALADVFGGEVDFSTELQPGDRFTVLADKQFRESNAFAGYGPIVAVELDNAGRRLRAVRYTPSGESPGYFDERGVSLRRFMLHSPLKFAPVVTSGFSRNRLHPILRTYRAHLGVDYKAPAGAPVIAVADGLVVQAGTNGGAGRMVHLRHANGFESEYLHLSSIAVRAGARVRQGDLIGLVGATGLATGPHLDYRVKKNGAFINPLTASRSLPPAEPLAAAEMAAFAVSRDRALAALSTSSIGRASAEVAAP